MAHKCLKQQLVAAFVKFNLNAKFQKKKKAIRSEAKICLFSSILLISHQLHCKCPHLPWGQHCVHDDNGDGNLHWCTAMPQILNVLIREQPLRPCSLLSLLTLCLLPHLLCTTSLRQQLNYACFNRCSSKSMVTLQQVNIAEMGKFYQLWGGGDLHNWRSYWTLKSSAVKVLRHSGLDRVFHDFNSTLWFGVCCFLPFLSVHVSLHILSLLVSAAGPVELRWPVEHRCGRTSSEGQGETQTSSSVLSHQQTQSRVSTDTDPSHLHSD